MRIDISGEFGIIMSAEVKAGNGAEFLFSVAPYQLNSLAQKRPVLLAMTEKSAHPVLASATKQVKPGVFSFPAERGAMNREGHIYIIRAETGEYKIGRTKNLPCRMNLFAVKLPFDFEIIHTFPCSDTVEAEKQLHAIFWPGHLRGEWFELTKMDVRTLKSVVEFNRWGEFIKADEDGDLWGMPELWGRLPDKYH